MTFLGNTKTALLKSPKNKKSSTLHGAALFVCYVRLKSVQMILGHQVRIAFIAVVQIHIAADAADRTSAGILPHAVAGLGVRRAADTEVCDPDVVVLQN